ncbi:hypothetical protein PG997_005002 [Apiospora hydei]|uniref:Uncharacterized protein n=1 Tax=Apiospora hydei TaxID=1337664 RepID=A0ABR1X3S2_9PEZI
MAGHGGFQPYDPGRCNHYARFASHLDRVHFEGLYWVMFVLVIFLLFLASWIYQWTMWYKEKPNADMDVYRQKLKRALVACIFIFLVSAATIVIETFCLLALQFCDGEDLMSLYWSTWTMMQVGSQIAIGGVVLALWHTIWNVKHPIWALAMGTPVLVVAGLGHVVSLCLHKLYKKAKAKHQAHSTRGTSIKEPEGSEKAAAKDGAAAEENSGGTTLNGDADVEEGGQRSIYRNSHRPSLISTIGGEERFFFEIDVGAGNAEVIRQWPSFVSMSEGRALIQAVLMRPGSDPYLDSRPWSPQMPMSPQSRKGLLG